MDLTRSISFRSYLLNDPDVKANLVADRGGIASGISGCTVDSVDFSDVDVVQYVEKKSESDGMDVGSPLLGMRRVNMAGTLYAKTRALLFDAVWELRAALSPVLAAREEPADKGYRPLYFSVPTNRIDEYAGGSIDLRLLAMPRATRIAFQRNAEGGSDADALAVPWQATFICKDPSIQAAARTEYDLSAGGTVSGNTLNRGTYLCPVSMLMVVGAAAGSIAVTVGDSVFTITVPVSTGARTIRFNGDLKVLTFEEGSVELPRYDLLTFSGSNTWPLVSTGTAAYTVTFTTVTPQAGSILFFYETFA